MIVFFGTSQYSAQFLNSALQNGLKIDLAVSAPAKPVGRRQILTENPVVSLAKKLKLPFETSLAQLPARQLTCPLTLGLALDFNQIIPQPIIDLFAKGIINIHFSKLPQYRGPSPVQATILNGETQAWISYHLITARLDDGPVLAQTSLPLTGQETTADLYQRLVEKAAQEIPSIVSDWLSDRLRPRPQEGQATYTSKLTASKAKIDWTKPPAEIDRLIRAAYPEPGAWTEVKLKVQSEKFKVMRLKILKTHLENNELVLDCVQLEGKNPVSWKQFKEGYPEAQIKI